jgi:hypothetical protein
VTDIALTVLGLACATLCVGVAGLLRRITDVKLAFGGYSGERRQFMIDSGRALPGLVVDEIPDAEEDALLVLGSGSCDICRAVLAELDVVQGQVLAGIVQEQEGSTETPLVANCTARLSDVATETLVREFDINQVPVAIAQRDGYVVGAAYGAAIGTGEQLRDFWALFGAKPLEVAT